MTRTWKNDDNETALHLKNVRSFLCVVIPPTLHVGNLTAKTRFYLEMYSI